MALTQEFFDWYFREYGITPDDDTDGHFEGELGYDS